MKLERDLFHVIINKGIAQNEISKSLSGRRTRACFGYAKEVY